VAEQGLTLLVAEDARQRVQALAPCFAGYYASRGSWDGLADAFQSPTAAIIVPTTNGTDGRLVQNALLLVGSEGMIGCLPLMMNSSLANLEFELFELPRFMFGPGMGRGHQQNQGQPDERQQGSPQSGGSGGSGSPFGLRALREMTSPEEMILTDANGLILASTGSQGLGQQLGSDALAVSVPIYVEQQVAGRLIAGTVLGTLNEAQLDLLRKVNSALLLSGLVAVGLASVLGLWMSGQVSAPVRDLMAGARQLAAGKWHGPLVVRARNEFGELTHAFNHMASEITRQQQLNRQMVADVAHDLRTPLSAMALEVEAIEAGFQTPEEATASLREEIHWLQRMVDDLRTLSLMDADQLRLQPERVESRDFLAGVVDFWQTMADEEKRTLTLDVPDSLPALEMDPGRMRQVLSNLIDNAFRHTREGSHITLRARAEAGALVIQVCDDGDGIPASELPHIFDRFYRVDPARRRSAYRDEGSGLGLSIARQLVEMHRGTITAESLPGHGATFSIRLPL
jgi:signal transduction histidine kinase